MRTALRRGQVAAAAVETVAAVTAMTGAGAEAAAAARSSDTGVTMVEAASAINFEPKPDQSFHELELPALAHHHPDRHRHRQHGIREETEGAPLAACAIRV